MTRKWIAGLVTMLAVAGFGSALRAQQNWQGPQGQWNQQGGQQGYSGGQGQWGPGGQQPGWQGQGGQDFRGGQHGPYGQGHFQQGQFGPQGQQFAPQGQFGSQGQSAQQGQAGWQQYPQVLQEARNFIRQNDQNNDGALSRNELPGNMSGNFQQLDRNGDGVLTANELAQHANRMAQNGQSPVEVVYVWVTGANRGQPSLSDLQNAYDMLQKVDEDGDGHITRSELRNTQTKVASQMISNLVNRLDQNQDDQISQDEASGTLLAQRFDQLDSDDDGYLTRSELKKDFQRELGQQSSVSQSQDQSGDSRR